MNSRVLSYHWDYDVCRQDSKILVYPLVLLLPGDVHHLIYEVAEAVLQSLHVVFSLVSVGVSRVLSDLNVQMKLLHSTMEEKIGYTGLHATCCLFPLCFK